MPVTVYINSTINDLVVTIEAPYNSRFVKQLKADIPKDARTWDETMPCTDPAHHKCKGRWMVRLDHAPQVIKMARTFFDSVKVTGPSGTNTFERIGPRD